MTQTAFDTPSPLWFFARGAGFVSLVLLTASVCAGILVSMRWRNATWPLFVTTELHRYVTLVFFCFLGLHITTVLLDPFAKLRLSDALIPFSSPYRPVWVGLGVVAAEAAAAFALSIFIRDRIGYRAWRVLHYGTYAILPLALVHSLGTGSDTTSAWGLSIYAACVLAVAVSGGLRLLHNPERWRRLRRPYAAAGAAGAIALVAWLVVGPLAPGWAVTAGTPAELTKSLAAPTPSPSPVPPFALVRPFQDRVTGTLAQVTDTSVQASGVATGTVDLAWSLNAQANDAGISGSLEVDRNDGSPICTASLIGSGEQGFVATCDPPGAQGSLTFVLALQRARTGNQLIGVLGVQGGTAEPQR